VSTSALILTEEQIGAEEFSTGGNDLLLDCHLVVEAGKRGNEGEGERAHITEKTGDRTTPLCWQDLLIVSF
jgi:hypothetical protein